MNNKPRAKQTNSRSANPPILTRELLEGSAIQDIIAREAPDMCLTTEDERQASLSEFLASKPEGDLWLFGYGSLIWNPALRTEERRFACIDGWHRAFCVSTYAGRGTPLRPGLVLGLDEGGGCRGVAFRIAEGDVQTELSVLWRREMLCGIYTPRWLQVRGADGEVFGNAIAFTINTLSKQYVGELSDEDIVDRLANAAGALGSSADYLFRTRDGLRANGITDHELEALSDLVEQAQAERALELEVECS